MKPICNSETELYWKQTIQHLQYLEGSNVGIIEK